MFEYVTYESLMDDMLSRVVINYPDIDTREGSIMWNAVSPIAVELARIYTELDNVLNESFAHTATREFLFMKCDEVGIDTSVFNATQGTFYADFNVKVPIDSRWNYDKYNFVVTEYVGEVDGHHRYYVKSETYGSAPNDCAGTMTPIDTTPAGLEYAVLVSCEILGENAWATEKVRAYYFEFIQKQAVDGNVAQYELWCQEYPGIGNYKIVSLWNGANTVKVNVLNSDNKPATPTLVQEFQAHLDPPTFEINDDSTLADYPQGRGMGNGVAPIGAIVTVTTATAYPVAISADVAVREGYSAEEVEENINRVLEDYFASIAYRNSKVLYMSVGAAIISAEGVDFISNLLLNGQNEDLVLGEEECPVLDETTWTMVTA